MIEISVNKINKNYGFDPIFKNLSFDIKSGEKIAIIGDNGCGKTTLLNIIAGHENSNSGNISIRKNSKIGYLKQIPDVVDNNIIVKDILYQGLTEIITQKEKLNKYEELMQIETGKKLEKVISKYAQLQEIFINLGGYEIEAKVGRIVKAFKIKNDLLERHYNSLSGGEKTIVSFASIILNEPDILLLDEPTNHLDIDTLEWLEDYLNNYKGTIVMVSHDRYFLDKVAKKIILISKENIEIFHGNYSYYLEEHENRTMLELKKFNNQEKEIEDMKKAIKKLQEFGKKGDNEAFFKRAANIQKRLDKLEKVDKPITKRDIPINFSAGNRTGKEVLKVDNLSILIDNRFIFKNASFDLFYQDKTCLMGPNGSGKTTLIKEIFKGNKCIKIGSNVRIGYIPQEITFEREDIRVLDEAKKYFIGEESHLRSSLSKLLFNGENVFKKLNTLSGGERIRLKLFCIMQENFNVLILDEPTNHIDIDTKEILENALEAYQGTLLFISHDRYFINKLAKKIIYISNNKLNSYIGNYDECKKYFN